MLCWNGKPYIKAFDTLSGFKGTAHNLKFLQFFVEQACKMIGYLVPIVFFLSLEPFIVFYVRKET